MRRARRQRRCGVAHACAELVEVGACDRAEVHVHAARVALRYICRVPHAQRRQVSAENREELNKSSLRASFDDRMA